MFVVVPGVSGWGIWVVLSVIERVRVALRAIEFLRVFDDCFSVCTGDFMCFVVDDNICLF